jgi:hypothetical protein
MKEEPPREDRDLENIFNQALQVARLLQSQEDFFILRSSLNDFEALESKDQQHVKAWNESCEGPVKFVVYPGLFKQQIVNGKPQGRAERMSSIRVWRGARTIDEPMQQHSPVVSVVQSDIFGGDLGGVCEYYR